MIRFILKKIGYAFLILFSVASVVFWLFSFSFPNPEDILVTDRTDEATLNAIKAELKLDQPKGQQYLAFLNDLSVISLYKKEHAVESSHKVLFTTGVNQVVVKAPYLRRSFQTGQPTKSILADAFIGTLVLALAAMIFASIFGLIFGVLSSVKQGSWVDRSLLFVSTLGISVPSFFSAIIFSFLFGHLWGGWTGLNVVGSLYEIDPFNGKQLALQNSNPNYVAE